MFCTKCGQKNQEEMSFCTNCGAPLRPAQKVQPQPIDNPSSPLMTTPGVDSGGNGRGKLLYISIAAALIVLLGSAGAVTWMLWPHSSRTPINAMASDSESTSGSTSTSSTATTLQETTTEFTTTTSTTLDGTGLVTMQSQSSTGREQGILQTLELYFGGINSGDYAQSWSQMDSSSQSRNSYSGFSKGVSTSQTSGVVVHSVTAVDSTTTMAFVTWISTQDPSMGPRAGEGRTYWTIDYTFKLVNGSWLIDRAAAHNGTRSVAA